MVVIPAAPALTNSSFISSLEGVHCWPGSQQETHVNNRIQIKILKTLRTPPKLKAKNRLQNGEKKSFSKASGRGPGLRKKEGFLEVRSTSSQKNENRKSCGHEESTYSCRSSAAEQQQGLRRMEGLHHRCIDTGL